LRKGADLGISLEGAENRENRIKRFGWSRLWRDGEEEESQERSDLERK
jgi:hypothetical protein